MQAIVMRESNHPVQKLGAPTMIFRSIIEIDDEGGDVGEPRAHHLLPLDQPITETIAGHFGGHAIDEPFIVGWQEDPHGCKLRKRLKIMVGSLREQATLPAPRERTDFDGCFGIHRDA